MSVMGLSTGSLLGSGVLGSVMLSEGPTSQFIFDGRPLPAGLTYSRASGATRINHRGYIEEVAANFALNANNPTANTVYQNFSGWTRQVVGSGVTASGLRFIDIRVQSAAGPSPLGLDLSGAVTAEFPFAPGGATVSVEVGVELIAGSLAGGIPRFNVQSRTGAGAFIANAVSGEIAVTAGSRPRVSAVLSATAERFGVQFYISTRGDGQPVDQTYRLTFPVINLGASYLSDSVPLGTLAARSNDVPSYGLLGLLLERAPATNNATWGRMEGGAAGSPGTVPTGTGVTTTTADGLTRTLAFGVEGGIAFTEYRYQGTTTVPNVQVLIGIAAGAAAAAAGQLWTVSAHMRLTAGALPASSVIRVVENGASVFTATDASVAGMTGAPLASQRFSVSRVFTDGLTNGATGLALVSLIPASGTAVDFTIRVGAPQIERGHLSSVILPPVGTPVVTSRAADLLDIDPTLIDLNRSTVAARFRIERGGTGVSAFSNQVVLGVSNGGLTDRVRIMTFSGVVLPEIRTNVAGVGGTVVASAVGSGLFQTVAASWGDAQRIGSWNGAASSVAAGWTGGVANTFQVGDSATNEPANITLQYLRIWRGRRLSAAQVQAQSARTT